MKNFKAFLFEKSLSQLKLYHASPKSFKGDFDINKLGLNNDPGYSGRGFYFTPNLDELKYMSEMGKPSYYREFKVDIKNPYQIKDVKSDIFSHDKEENETEVEFLDRMTEEIKSAGYDGVVRFKDGKIEEVVAFYPEQIKPIGEWKEVEK